MKTPRETVVDWLSQRAGFKRTEAEKLTDATISEIVADPLNALTKLLGKEPKAHRLTELTRMLQNTRQAVETTTGMSTDSQIEHRETVEMPFLRMQRAVDEAAALGLVKVEYLPSQSPTTQTAYLLGSSHYSPNISDPRAIDPLVKSSQVELFQLAVLMQRNKVPGRLLVEGVRQIGGDFPRGRFLLPDGRGRAKPLQSPEQQEYFFQHPKELEPIIDELISAGRGSIPLFYRLSSFPFDGSERKETQERTDAFMQRLHRSLQFHPFLERVKNAGAYDQSTGLLRAQTEHREGKTYLVLAQGMRVDARELKAAAEAHLATMDEWKEIDLQREQDTCTFLKDCPHETVPMAWMGLAHAHTVADALKEHMNIRIVIPRSSAHVDGRLLSANQDENREIGLTAALLRAANQALTHDS